SYFIKLCPINPLPLSIILLINESDSTVKLSSVSLIRLNSSTASDYIITEEVISHLKEELKTAYENTRPKIDKSVRNDLKET
ncbi:hypothetical protein IDG69_15460, partial [Staphylococcus sp. EG-SA-23]|nr:hypothetical protein [Staphylococcus sp. EG-SA-23]